MQLVGVEKKSNLYIYYYILLLYEELLYLFCTCRFSPVNLSNIVNSIRCCKLLFKGFCNFVLTLLHSIYIV